MKAKKILFVVLLIGLAFAGRVNAAIQFDGSFGTFNEGGGSYSSSTLTLLADNYVNGSIGGDFVGILPQYSLITTYSTEITGLGTSPTSVPISDFFQIADPGHPFGGAFNGAGTLPANRFDFNLATLTETGTGVFYGTGTMVDTTGAYANSPAYFTLSFAGQGSYSFTFAAVPEPGAYGACASALALLPVVAGMLRNLRRRQVA